MAKKKVTLETPEKVKILGFSASPRKVGGTAEMIKLALKSAESMGYVETEYISLADHHFAMCVDCKKCYSYNKPVGDPPMCYDDPLAESHWLFAKIQAADGIIYGFPVYGGWQPALLRMALENHGAGAGLPREGDTFTKHGQPVMGTSITVEDYKPIAIISQGGQQYSSEEIAYFTTVHRSGPFHSGAWPTVEDPEPQSSFAGGMLVCVDAMRIYDNDAWTSSGCRTWPPLTGIQNERTVRNLGKWLAVSTMMMKLGRLAYKESGIPAIQVHGRVRYSIKPKAGSVTDRDIKEGRMTYVSQEDLKERMKVRA